MPGGTAAIVVKTNVVVDPDLANWRQNLIANHQVLAAISLPTELFYPTAAPTVIFSVRAHVPAHDQKSLLALLQNDGYEISKKRRIALGRGANLQASSTLIIGMSTASA